ncbi:phage morphogenesis protein [Flavobacterium sp. N1994]|uniref:phage morphogenesis protein n=1 Tax=Flavobacterium sp. N1994 TaxID=2986827 RepID=UPI0022228B58|nr:phage morphogenesis protein [Flavobacterium sp. N1994]
MATLDDLEKMLLLAAEQIPEKALTIIEVEGKNFIQKNFQDQGFTDSVLDEWEERKTTDKKGRDITTYRTNRRGKKGSLNKYGSDIKDRAILVGKGTGGNKLKNSIKSRVNRSTKEVRYYTDKEYAARHNEGLDGMPERRFMGKSKYLDGKISDKLKRELDKIFK